MNRGTEKKISGLWAEIRNQHPHNRKQKGIHSTATEKRQSSPVTGLDRPRGFQEVKVFRFRDKGTGWW